MICLNNRDKLEAWSDTDAVIESRISGLAGSVGSRFKSLYVGTLGNVADAIVYAATDAVAIVSMSFTNNSGGAATVNLKLNPANGASSQFVLPLAVSLGAGSCLAYDGSVFSVMNTSGHILVVGPSPLDVSGGGTGLATITDHAILLGSGVSPITPMAVLAAGEIIYGVAGADPVALAAGATTKIFVGGGAAAPVWTEATGTGAPVRANAPTGIGQWTIPTINLTGGQIAFPATAVPSADPNTLDDYEIGVYDITVACSTSGTITVKAAVSSVGYEKIGSFVHIHGSISIDAVNLPVGSPQFSLPFANSMLAERADWGVGSGFFEGIATGTDGWLCPHTSGGGVAYFTFLGTDQDGSLAILDAASVGANDELSFSLSYRTDL